MKKVILLLSVVFVLGACKDDNKGRLSADARIKITGVNSITKAEAPAADPEGIRGTGITDSLNYIARYTWEMAMYLQSLQGPSRTGLGFDDEGFALYHDTIANKFFFWGDGIVNAEGGLGWYLTDCTDIVFTTQIENLTGLAIHPKWIHRYDWSKLTTDTIAYIPNSVVLKARADVTAALAREDYAACYRIFDEAFVFLPTTGPKWRALKAAGIE